MDGKGHLYGSVSLYFVQKYSRVIYKTAQHWKITAVKAAVSNREVQKQWAGNRSLAGIREELEGSRTRIYPPFLFSRRSKPSTTSVTSLRSTRRTTTTRTALRGTAGTSGWRGAAGPKLGPTPASVRSPSFSCPGLSAICEARQHQEPRVRQVGLYPGILLQPMMEDSRAVKPASGDDNKAKPVNYLAENVLKKPLCSVNDTLLDCLNLLGQTSQLFQAPDVWNVGMR